MTDIAHLYSEGLYRTHKHLATWLPGAPIQLGDVGRMKKFLWGRETALPDGVWDKKIRSGGRISSLDWQSTNKFTIDTKVAGQADPSFTGLAKADGGIAYTFTEGDAVIFHADDIETEEVADNAPIRRWMLNEHRAGRLDLDTVVITRVRKAKSCVVLITESDGARVELKASAAVTTGERTNGKLSGNLEIVRATGMFLHLVVQDCVPLFGGIRLRKRLFGQPHIHDILLGDQSADPDADMPVRDDDDPFELVGLPE